MKVMLVDGNNLVYRGFAQAQLTHDGQRTEAIYLGLRQLLYYMSEFHPDEMVIVWDCGLNKWRKAALPEYKRAKKELTFEDEEEIEQFRKQKRCLRAMLKELGIVQYCCEGEEADDVIASIIVFALYESILLRNIDSRISFLKERYLKSFKYYINSGFKCFYSSGDSFQIVSTDVDFYMLLSLGDFPLEIYSPRSGLRITKKIAEESLGIPLNYYPLYKALLGGHDNIPGIKGIGSIWARKIIEVVSGGKKVDELSVRERGYYNMYRDNLNLVGLWEQVARFMILPPSVLEQGRIEQPVKPFMDWAIAARVQLRKYGFDSYLKRFAEFSSPFQDYFIRNRQVRNG